MRYTPTASARAGTRSVEHSGIVFITGVTVSCCSVISTVISSANINTVSSIINSYSIGAFSNGANQYTIWCCGEQWWWGR